MPSNLSGQYAAILQSKITPPISGRHHLQREDIVQTIADADSARLVMVSAGAGFGKSTLLQQYHAHCLTIGRAAIWLTADASDNDLQRFINHIDAAFHRQRTAPDPGGDGALFDAGDDLLNRIGTIQVPFSLLIDEFEQVKNQQVLDFVQQLLERMPPTGLLLIGSRTTPDFRVGRLRARGQVIEIGPILLRFSQSETSRLVRDIHKLALGDEDIAALHRQTEGWPAAIYLAILSLYNHSDYATFVASFSGSHLELAEYLAEDILSKQSIENQAFLMETSILDQLTAPLCDAITGRNDSQQVLDYLESANLFLFPADDRREWYRYHRLFASFLHGALKRRDPERPRALQRAAARWYFSVNRPIRAINHLIEARDIAEASRRIAEHAAELMNAGRSRLLLRWLDHLPTDMLYAEPKLLVACAWALIVNRHYQDASRILEYFATKEQDAQYKPYTLEIDTLRCLLLLVTDRVEECCVFGLKQLDHLLPSDQ
ncbi:MAG: hypothetical protein ACK5HY_00355, partial [Parahaliea sp.]